MAATEVSLEILALLTSHCQPYMQRTHFHVSAAPALLSFGGALLAVLLSPLFASAQSTTSPTFLSCSPSATSVVVGQSISFTATGGTGIYAWGTSESAIPASPLRTITYTPIQSGAMAVFVQSGTQSASCAFTALAPTTGGGVGLPNTGGGGSALPAVGALVAVLGAGTLGFMGRRSLKTSSIT